MKGKASAALMSDCLSKLPTAVQSCVLELSKLASVPWFTYWYLLGEEAEAGENTRLILDGKMELETYTNH